MSPVKSEVACAEKTELFFEDLWTAPYSVSLAAARDHCDTCPARVGCLKLAMEIEGTSSLDYRAGIYAGFTPQQRHSLMKRGTAFEGIDPVELRQDIPDRGDQWTARHTKLARIVIDWLASNIDVGAVVPEPLPLSRQLKVGVKDLRRVYTALKEDHVIVEDGDVLVRQQTAASARWTPRHLRPSHGDC